MLKQFLLIVATATLLVVSTGIVQAKELKINTQVQAEIRPSYPFPEFLSTGPYIWYEDAENTPIRGHTYRLATFTVDSVYRVYLEKVIFGIDGCCLEIVDYRELMITEADLRELFPNNKGTYGFKLINWRSATSFIFNAHGGKYLLTNIDSATPTISETTANE